MIRAGLTALLLLLSACTPTGTAVSSVRTEPPAASATPRSTQNEPTATPRPLRSTLAPREGAYLGLYVDPDSYADLALRSRPLDPVEAALGRRVAIDHIYYSFSASFPERREYEDLERGRIPMLSWERANAGRILSGDLDAQLTIRARAIRDLGGPVFIRWAWDMDRPEAEAFQSGADEYVRAWRYIVDIFRQEGAHNALWVWSPSMEGAAKAQAFYPGDEHVDWIATSVYDASGTAGLNVLLRGFYETWAPRGKPLMLSAIRIGGGSAEGKAVWLQQTAHALRAEFPQVRAAVFWDAVPVGSGPRPDLRLSGDPVSLRALADLARDPYFAPVLEPRSR